MGSFSKMPFANNGAPRSSTDLERRDGGGGHGYAYPYNKPKYAMTVEKSEPSTRKRIPIACGRCRKRKIRCSGDEGNGQPCSNCRAANHSPCQFLRVSATEATLRLDGPPLRETDNFHYNMNAARHFQATIHNGHHNGHHQVHNHHHHEPPVPYEPSMPWSATGEFDDGRMSMNRLSFQGWPSAGETQYGFGPDNLPAETLPNLYSSSQYHQRYVRPVQEYGGRRQPSHTGTTTTVAAVEANRMRNWGSSPSNGSNGLSIRPVAESSNGSSTPRRNSMADWRNASVSPYSPTPVLSPASNYPSYHSSPTGYQAIATPVGTPINAQPVPGPMPTAAMSPAGAEGYAPVSAIEHCAYPGYAAGQAAVAPIAVAASPAGDDAASATNGGSAPGIRDEQEYSTEKDDAN